jgi:DNA (cytosine-5)-methyltransferase 1
MCWKKPASTITTKFFNISNGRFAHPEEDRAISLREGATLQTFPKDYDFKTTSIAATAKLIGNAVPPEYARRIGLTIINNSSNGTV